MREAAGAEGAPATAKLAEVAEADGAAGADEPVGADVATGADEPAGAPRSAEAPGVSNAAGASRKRFPFTVARRIVQIAVLLVFAVPVIAAGWGLFGNAVGGDNAMPAPGDLPFFGTLSASQLFGIDLLDPFALLQAVAAAKAVAPRMLLAALPVLVVYGAIRGRVFCGWCCPVNLLLEFVDWLRAKLHIKVEERVVPRHAKAYVAVGVLVLSALLGFPVFEALSPISFINKGLVLGSMAGGLTLLAIVLAELFWGHRVWCRSLCPLGGFWEVVGKVGLVNVHIDHQACIGCKACQKACLSDPEILAPAIAGDEGRVCAGDCMLCGKCVEACPTAALSVRPGR